MSWKHNFQLKDLLSEEDQSPEKCRSLGLQVAQRLDRATFFGRYRRELMNEFEDVIDQEDFNAALDHLYDCADELGIWCGLKLEHL